MADEIMVKENNGAELDEVDTAFKIAQHIIYDFSAEDMLIMNGYGLSVVQDRDISQMSINDMMRLVAQKGGIVEFSKNLEIETASLLDELGMSPKIPWLDEKFMEELEKLDKKEESRLDEQRRLELLRQQEEMLKRQHALSVNGNGLQQTPPMQYRQYDNDKDVILRSEEREQEAGSRGEWGNLVPVQKLDIEKADAIEQGNRQLDRTDLQAEKTTMLQTAPDRGLTLSQEQNALSKEAMLAKENLDKQLLDKDGKPLEMESNAPKVEVESKSEITETVEKQERREEQSRERAGTIASLNGLDINLAREGVDKSSDDQGSVAIAQNSEDISDRERDEAHEEVSRANGGAEVDCNGIVVEETKPNFLDDILKDEDEEWKNDPILAMRAQIREEEEEEEWMIKTKI